MVYCTGQKTCRTILPAHALWPVSNCRANRHFLISYDMGVDPAEEYRSRLYDWSRRAEAFERSHSRMGNARALFLFGTLAVAAVLCRTQASWGVALMLLLLGLVLTGIWHVHIEAARNAARRGS